MAKTTLSAQQVLNTLNGSHGTAKSLQAVANSAKGNAGASTESLQSILNKALGNATATTWTEQRCLYTVLKPKLALTGNVSEYSEQDLLNLAKEQGGISLNQILGLAP